MSPSDGKDIGLTGWVGKESTRRRLTRWLPVPAAMVLFALIGMAISTEDRNEFQTRSNQVAARPDTDATSSTATTAGAGGDPQDPSTTQTTLTPASDPTAPPSGSTGEPEGSSGGAAVSFEITAARGRLGIELGGRGPLARPVGLDGTIGQPVKLLDGPTSPTTSPTTGDGTSAATGGGISGAGSSTTGAEGTTIGDGAALDGLGQPVGLRLGDDGRLEPVGQEDITAGDLVVTPTEDGLDVLLAGGARVEIQPGARPDRTPIDVTEVSSEGARSQLVPDDRGEITLGNGLTIRVPSLDEADDDTPSWLKTVSSGRWRWVALALAVVVALAVLAQLYRRRRPAPAGEPNGAGWVESSGVPAHRFEEFLDLLAADPDPARAVRLAFSAAERGLGHLPRRQSTETPFEWHRRVAADRPDLAEPLAGLCGCFANIRFAPAPATAQERDLGVAELRRLHRLSRHGPVPANPPAAPVEVGAGV